MPSLQIPRPCYKLSQPGRKHYTSLHQNLAANSTRQKIFCVPLYLDVAELDMYRAVYILHV